MKVFTMTQESDEGEWTGTLAFATAEKAMAYMNEVIDEHNEDADERVNHVIWPERRGDWTYSLGFYRYHFEIHNLEE